jgi:hypothetical protein
LKLADPTGQELGDKRFPVLQHPGDNPGQNRRQLHPLRVQ